MKLHLEISPEDVRCFIEAALRMKQEAKQEMLDAGFVPDGPHSWKKVSEAAENTCCKDKSVKVEGLNELIGLVKKEIELAKKLMEDPAVQSATKDIYRLARDCANKCKLEDLEEKAKKEPTLENKFDHAQAFNPANPKKSEDEEERL